MLAAFKKSSPKSHRIFHKVTSRLTLIPITAIHNRQSFISLGMVAFLVTAPKLAWSDNVSKGIFKAILIEIGKNKWGYGLQPYFVSFCKFGVPAHSAIDSLEFLVKNHKFQHRPESSLIQAYLRQTVKEDTVEVEDSQELRKFTKWMDESAEDAIFGRDDCWKEFYKKYPAACGCVKFGKIVLNRQASLAIVDATYRFDALGGYSSFYILKRSPEGWKVVDKALLARF